MSDKPLTTYVVSVFEKPHWRTVLTTMVKIEEITPKQKGRPRRPAGRSQRGAMNCDSVTRQNPAPLRMDYDHYPACFNAKLNIDEAFS